MSDMIDYDKMFGLENNNDPADDNGGDQEQPEELDENAIRRQRMIDMHERYEASKKKKSFYERAGVDNVMYDTGAKYGSRQPGLRYYSKPPTSERNVRDIDALLYLLTWLPMVLVMAITVGVCRWLDTPPEGYFYCLCMGAGIGMVVKYNLNDNMTFSQAAKHCMPVLISLFVIMMFYTLGLITGVVQTIVDQIIN